MSRLLDVFKKLANFVGSDVVGVATQLPRQLPRTHNSYQQPFWRQTRLQLRF